MMAINNALSVGKLDSDALYKEWNICHDTEHKI